MASEERGPNRAQLFEAFDQAVGAAKRGDVEYARERFTALTEVRPDLAAAWMWRAHLAENAPEEIAFLRKAVAIDADNPRARQSLARALLERGIDLAKRGEATEARSILREATVRAPQDAVAWLWLAAVADSVDERSHFVDRALEVDPDNAHAHDLRAELDGQVPAAAPAARCVLVVDASATVRRLVHLTFERRDVRVLESDSAIGMAMALQGEYPDVILLAIDLPDAHGFELCRQLVGHPDTRDARIFVLTPRESRIERFRAKRAGAVDSIAKPFTANDLLSAAGWRAPVLKP